MEKKCTLQRVVLMLLLISSFTLYAQSGFMDVNFNSSDQGYNLGSGADGLVGSIAIRLDGKILIGGTFTIYNGVSFNYIAQLNSDGSIDTGFNYGSGPNAMVRAIVVQSDGKILIGGEFTSYNSASRNRIARLNTDGSLDTSFEPEMGTNDVVETIVVQPDGKILIGGAFTTYNGTTRNYIARLNADGSLDSSFNSGTGANNWVNSIAVQPDGKILIGGEFTSYNSASRNRIARLNTDGSLDTGFDPGSGANSLVHSIALQPDGKILIGGSFTIYNGATLNYIARLDSDGSLDASFNSGSGTDNTVIRVVVQPDGKIIIGSAFSSYNGTLRNRIARINADGSLDTSFDPGTGASWTIWSLAVQPDGKILIGGGFWMYNGTARNRIARLIADGSLDSGFNPVTGANNWVYSTVVQPDGKILIGGGFTVYNDIGRNRIARLNSDGSLDTGFNSGTGANNWVYSTAIQPDGKILIGGSFTNYNGTMRNRIARLNSDGSLDTGFNPGSGTNNQIEAIAVQPDGKILIGGSFTTYNGTSRNRIARLNSDGSLDTGFNPGSGTNNQVEAIAVQSDGKILIGGWFTTYNGTSRNRIARINDDGSLDISFNTGSGANNWVYSTAIQPDGKILIGGWFSAYNGTMRNRVARLNADGSLDTDFDPGMGANNSVEVIAVQPNGKILIGGTFTTYNDTSRNSIARLNADGSLDSGFNPGTGADNYVRALALQPDAMVVIGGDFVSYNGIGRNRVARVVSDFVLPVTWQYFEAKLLEKHALLKWGTSSEINNQGFDIERSTDGLRWDAIAFVSGQGTTTEAHEYTYIDEKAMPGANYYRLRQVDYDGHFEYSNIVIVLINGARLAVYLFPNPTKGTIQLPGNQFDKIEVHDLTGRMKLHISQPGSELDLSVLPAGAYLLKIADGHNVHLVRVVKQ